MKQLDNIISIKEYDIKQQLPNYIIKGIWYHLNSTFPDIYPSKVMNKVYHTFFPHTFLIYCYHNVTALEEKAHIHISHPYKNSLIHCFKNNFNDILGYE